MIYSFVLTKPLAAFEQFHLLSLIHKAWVNPLYGVQAVPHGAAHWDRPTITIRH